MDGEPLAGWNLLLAPARKGREELSARALRTAVLTLG